MNGSGQALSSLGSIDTRTKEGRLPQRAQELGRRENKWIYSQGCDAVLGQHD